MIISTSNLQIRGMGMNSPDLLLLVENCPKGAETLVTRCLHILTDKGAYVIRMSLTQTVCLP